ARLRHGHRRQPRHRRPLLGPRPAGEVLMSARGAAVRLPRPAGGSGSARAAWRRFRRHRGGLFGLTVVALLVAVAVLAPLLAPHDPFTTSRDAFLPPLVDGSHPL